VRSTNVPNFIEIQNTWCNPFGHLAWNDPCTSITGGIMMNRRQL